MTVEDLLSGKSYPDVIGWSTYGWDLADPKKPSYQPMHGKPKPELTPIPYGIMVPKGIANVICPGRSISVQRELLGPMRVMAPVMAMGQAAGTAARQVVQRDVPFAAIDTNALRTDLRKEAAILEI